MRNSLKSALVLAAGLAPIAAQAAAPVCLRSYMIDHTKVQDDKTILFTMRDGSVYRNDLPDRCVGLAINTRGFTYQPTDPGTDEICSNLVTIRVNDTGQVCILGAFTPVPKTPQAPN